MNSTTSSGGFSLSRLLQPAVLIKTAVLFYCLFTVFASGLPFFGDHVTLVSAPANYFFDTRFHSLLLPPDLDTGHPPFYAAAVALVWLIFGRSLFVTHCITLICVLFLITQYYLLAKKLLDPKAQGFALLLFIFQPVILAQTAAMSSDILLTALFLAALNGWMRHQPRKWIMALAVGLMISLRGWVGLTALVFMDLTTLSAMRSLRWKKIMQYGFALLPFLIYIVIRHSYQGYWLTPADGPWAQGREWVSGWRAGGKCFEFVVRLLEFGMVVPVIILLTAFLKMRKAWWKEPVNPMLFCAALSLAIFTLPFRNPILIRYFLPVILLMILAFSQVISNWHSKAAKRLTVLFTGLLFISAHFYAYPQMQNSLLEYSWGDGSLAHLSYFEYRAKGREFLNEQHIRPEEVYTGFPEYKSFAATDLKGDDIHYQTLDTASLSACHYVIYSNIMNGIPQTTELILKNNWKRIAGWKSYPVEYSIFENPAYAEKSSYR